MGNRQSSARQYTPRGNRQPAGSRNDRQSRGSDGKKKTGSNGHSRAVDQQESAGGQHKRIVPQGNLESLEELLGIWPEYNALDELNTTNLSNTVGQNLNAVFQTLIDHHLLLKTIRKEKQDLRSDFDELLEERHALKQSLQLSERETTLLQDDVEFLQDELRKIGSDVKLLDRRDFQNGRQLSDERGGISRSHRVSKRLQRKAEHGFAKPTPLLQAEGYKGMEFAVQRTPGARSPSSGRRFMYEEDLNKNPDEEIDHRIIQLQNNLESERRDKQQLKQRLDVLNPDHVNQSRDQSANKLAEEYKSLMWQAQDEISGVMDSKLGHVDTKRKQEFLGLLVESAFDVCTETVAHFYSLLHEILLHPTGGHHHGDRLSKQPVRRKSSVLRSIQMFDDIKSKNTGHSKLALRTMSAGKVPQKLLDEVGRFLEERSTMFNITAIADEVVGVVDKTCPECTTPALIQHDSFNKFLHSLCRLMWQMNILNPPMHISSESGSRFEETYHMTLVSEHVTNAEIDYFIWPILYSKRNGEVLCKGLVNIRMNTEPH